MLIWKIPNRPEVKRRTILGEREDDPMRAIKDFGNDGIALLQRARAGGALFSVAISRVELHREVIPALIKLGLIMDPSPAEDHDSAAIEESEIEIAIEDGIGPVL